MGKVGCDSAIDLSSAQEIKMKEVSEGTFTVVYVSEYDFGCPCSINTR